MTITYSDFTKKLKSYLDKVLSSQDPLFITRTKGGNVVVLSQSNYDSIMETFYLLKSPKNANRLLNALGEYNKGVSKEQNIEA